MLNLVQLQERLKDVPIQALMQYANGANPQIPPFLALGELNRRKKMQESAAAEQAQEMEGSTVKQQIEQAAGLMALQGNRQRQAAQQQQGIQAAMPMAAPNTTTSEPAQLAGGGFIDDIVVPRDYQAGGAVNPEMLKRLMMMKAMRRPGVAGLPINTFKRGDFAGGGIVAFRDGGSTFSGFETEGSAGTVESAAPSEPSYARSSQLTATKEQIAMMSLAELQEYYRTGKIPDRLRSVTAAPRQVSPTDTLRPSGQRDTTAKRSVDAQDAVQRYLNIDPEKALQDIARQTPEKFKEEREGLNKLFGVSADPYADLKRRYSEVEEEDRRTKAGQPMDQLARFLTGIAGSRRGAGIGEAGAAGAAASSKLREEQTALNRKQALDMAALQSAIAEKEDARARGDRDAYIAADQKIKDANIALQRDRLEVRRTQAQILNQNIQAQQTGRGGFPPERRAIMIQQAVQKRLDANPRIKILELSNKPEDKAELEQIKKRAFADAMAEVQAIMNSMEGLGSLEGVPTGGQRIRYDAQGNPIQ